MDANFFVLLALLLGTRFSKVDGDVSNMTDTTSVSQIVTNTSHQLGSETKPSDGSRNRVSESSKEDEDASRKQQGEDCDPSYMCSDDQHLFLACLRVPGDDAPHLSLLIQNKAKSVLNLTITAPAFVRLETYKAQLLQSQDTKVKVSIINKGGSNESTIILTSTNGGHCSLDLKDLAAAAHETGNSNTVAVSRPSILNISSRTLIVIAMISFLLLSLVVIPVIVHLCRSKSHGKSKYQRLDMELPISTTALVSKSDQERGDDGWNNNWGDDWDDGDEEQPVLPLTPTVSSRGLAPRRLTKEGWKD